MQKNVFRKALVFVAAMLIIAIITLGIIFQVQQDRSEKYKNRIVNTYRVIDKAELITRLVNEEIIKLRGFSTQPYPKADPTLDTRRQIYNEYEDIRVLVSGNPSQTLRLEPIRKLVYQRIRLTDSISRLFATDPGKAMALMNPSNGNRDLIQIRRALDDFRAKEKVHIQLAGREVEHADRILSQVQPALYSLIGGFIFIVIVLIYRGQKKANELDFQGRSESIVLENIFEAVVRTNRKGIITLWNRRAEEVFGWTSSEVLGLHVQDLFKITEEERTTISRALNWTGHWSGELLLNNKSGERLNIQYSSSVINIAPNKIYGTVSILRDITKRIKREQQLSEEKANLSELLADQLEESRMMNRELAGLNEKMENAREKERVSISNELHDNIGNDLASIKMSLNMIYEDLDLKENPLKARFKSTIDQLGETCSRITALSSKLKPKMLEDLGFFSTLKTKAENFSAESGIRVVLSNETEELYFDDEESLELFRITEQVLKNIQMHSQANTVMIATQLEDDCFVLSIKDNGSGFKKISTGEDGLGFSLIQEKAKKIGAITKINSQPGKGTEFTIILPLPE